MEYWQKEFAKRFKSAHLSRMKENIGGAVRWNVKVVPNILEGETGEIAASTLDDIISTYILNDFNVKRYGVDSTDKNIYYYSYGDRDECMRFMLGLNILKQKFSNASDEPEEADKPSDTTGDEIAKEVVTVSDSALSQTNGIWDLVLVALIVLLVLWILE